MGSRSRRVRAPERKKEPTTTEAAACLYEFAYLERACAHLRAGWIVKTADLDQKIAWGQHFSADMEHATRLYARARGLMAGEPASAKVPARWRDFFRKIDGSSESEGVQRGIYAKVKPRLQGEYEKYLVEADPVADASSVEIVESARRAAQAQLAWAKASRTTLSSRNLRLPKNDAKLEFDEGLWQPLARAERVTRPGFMKRGEPGALRLLPINPRSRKDTGIFLHNFLNEEFATLELIARNSYEHPEMPLAFHRDCARHASDEARHAQMFTDALADYGVQFGDLPIYTYSYEGEYEFPPMPWMEADTPAAGSRRELLWRILLRQVIHEGKALDSSAFEIRKRNFLKQPRLAHMFGYILADEILHAGAGVRWSRYLAGGDEEKVEREQEMAWNYYSARLKDRRLTWGANHIEEAARETKQLEELARHHHFPFRMGVNVAARREAGFRDKEIRKLKKANI